ncbi:response regulator transcription factor [Clostridium sp. AWRP]|uniref:response regulator transcription factor n=1 Tax=Clostridium sp. AWRP TaxID=2212991 RepID=UPI000FD964A6|nr:response regulator transcription factor [Clostridium sp. AWRP]AZV58544.1 response regulator transcription factor [Clostridium sp. AWRP]
MIHIIIILHFLCFSLGVGCITLSWLVYKKHKKNILEDIVIGEIIFSIWLLIDTLFIYIRKILSEYKIENIFNVISYFLAAAVIFYVYKIIKKVKDNELYKKINVQIKIIIGLIIVTCILFLFSYKIVFLKDVPYLCLIYILQCILVIIYCIKEERQIVHEGKNDLKCLTNREKEIADYICMGLSNKEIGEKLFISANTVKNHVYNIYKKVNVKNKVELINLINRRD